jgi:hypothetical protein
MTNISPKPDTILAVTPPESPPPPPPRPPRGRRPNPYRHVELRDVPLLRTVQEAAAILRVTEEALRARLRRAQVIGPDGTITAPLAPGIVGVKVGTSWRIRFDGPT